MYGCGCCSEQCERKMDCALYYANTSNQAIVCVENFYTYGSGSITTDISEVLWWCGPRGDWGMFVPVNTIQND